ncbi:MAG TPA: DNA polymerase Y family protein [Nevskiaceae bacterium]|nr:DNA polymerase Y family protein [Nevskiaceae bacterium]
MLWLCIHLPELPLEALASSENLAAAIEHEGSRRHVLSCTVAATEAGITVGLDAASAQALAPQIKLLERSPRRERETLRALAGWAYQYSSTISAHTTRRLLWIEVGTSLKLFGGLARLQQLIASGIEALGYRAQIGVAPTLEAAALCALLAPQPPVTEKKQITARIEKFPISALALPDDVLQGLQASGLRRIGEIYALGYDELARRFSRDTTEYLRRLIGMRPETMRPYRPPETYQRQIEFNAAIETTEGLGFSLRRMLGEFQGYLRGRDTGVQQFELVLEHEHVPPTTLQVKTSRPQRDAAQLHSLLREQLNRSPIAAPVIRLRLQASSFADPGDTQLDFFDGHKRQDEEWFGLLDKLSARLGREAVRTLGLQSDHRPEKAWCVLRDGPAPEIPGPLPERPLWLLPQPKQVDVLPLLTSRPERIEDGWWEGDDSRRDYYTAQTRDGSRLWLYRDGHNLRWYLHGVWA